MSPGALATTGGRTLGGSEGSRAACRVTWSVRSRRSHPAGRAPSRSSGEVDLASATDLEACIRRALEGSPSSVVLDLAGLTFIDSSGLRVLVSVSADARSQAVSFGLRNVPGHAQRVLDITGLSGMFDGS